MSALRKAFIDQLQDLLDAERQLLKALPKMAKAAQNEQLRTAFREHENETAQQIRKLGQVFEAFEESPRGKRCKGMEGLIAEAEEMIQDKEGDAALIAAAQKAEHYEISSYGTLSSWAVALGHEETLHTLTAILEEEKDTDRKLTILAQSVVNAQDTLREEEKRKPAARRTRKPRQRMAARRATNRVTRSPRSKRLRSVSHK